MIDEVLRRLKRVEELTAYLRTAVGKPHYNSGWFAVTGGSAYTKQHNLGAVPNEITVLAANDAAGTVQAQVCPSVFWHNGSAAYSGYRIYGLTSTALTILAHDKTHYDGTVWATSGYYCIKARL